ncbi:MAG: AlbA family DNA-binding domain-containing protein, partial [Streptosporangiaceae bacterium]
MGAGMADEFDPARDLAERVARWAAAGEQYEVEFKSELRRPLNDRDLVEAVVCLANGRGGVLLIGVEDDGTVTGAQPRHEAGRTDLFRVQALVANMTQPPISVVASLTELAGQDVLVVEVPASPRVVGTTQGTYLRRAIGGDGRPTCVPYHAHEMLAHEVDRGAVDWAAVRVGGARWEDLDPLEFERLRQLASRSGTAADGVLASLSDREIASALGLLRSDADVTAGALLLFGKTDALRCFLPTHEAAFQVLRGENV